MPPPSPPPLGQVSELLPALEGPGGALCGYVEAHAFLASVKEAAEVAGERAKAAEVRVGWGRGGACSLGSGVSMRNINDILEPSCACPWFAGVPASRSTGGGRGRGQGATCGRRCSPIDGRSCAAAGCIAGCSRRVPALDAAAPARPRPHQASIMSQWAIHLCSFMFNHHGPHWGS